MSNSKEQYIQDCMKENSEVFIKRPLVEYVRNKKGHAVGVVVAFRDPFDDNVCIGWSLCNIKVERFNKHIGLNKALNRAEPIDAASHRFYTSNGYCVPLSAKETYEHLLYRAVNYFKPESMNDQK